MNSTKKNIFRSVDWITVGFYLLFVIWGWFTIYSASYNFEEQNLFSLDTNSGKQLLWIALASGIAIVLMAIEKRFYEMYSTFIYWAFIIILVVTLVIAPDTKGSRSWIPIGFMKLQPAEFAKFSVALVLGHLIDKLGFSMKNRKDAFKAAMLVLLPMAIIILQKETGSALVYLAFFLMLYREGMSGTILFYFFAAVVYFVVGIRFEDELFQTMPVSIGEFSVLLLAQIFTTGLTYVLVDDKRIAKWMGIIGIGTTLILVLFSMYVIPFNFSWILILLNIAQAVYLIYLGINTRVGKCFVIAAFAFASTIFFYISGWMLDHMEDHQRVRIEVLLGKKSDKRGAEYNVNQAKIAIGSGGLAGKGYLNGTQNKLRYVPEQETDFIFCTIGEEGGFIASLILLVCFLLFIWRIIYLAERQPDTPGRVYGYSVACIFIFHIFINIGMVIGITPVIGIPLPFFSYGGSSLFGFTILLFIFLRMDAESRLSYKVQ